MEWKKRIDSKPEILSGKPCIAGTRIPVSLILGYLANGYEHDEIVEEFPDLTPEDIQASLEYARELSEFETAV
jgi:uncharacterized protein (DUF433 family)